MNTAVELAIVSLLLVAIVLRLGTYCGPGEAEEPWC
jgi:hypothetical protein